LLFGLGPVFAVLVGASGGPSTPAITPSSPAGVAIVRQLEEQLLPAPAGYNADFSGEVPDGGIAGSAAQLGFRGGHQASYSSHTTGDNDEGGSFLDIQLLCFSSPGHAESYEMTVNGQAVPGQPREPFAAIPGAIAVAGQNAIGTSAACCEHEVLATKGPVEMLVDYIAPGAVGMPPTLAASAEQQYARLRS
jgi:hypothetical protein